MYNLLIGGAAGDGIETMASLLEKIFKRSGLHVFGIRDVMSRIRGGHNFAQIRFGPEPVTTHQDRLDGIIALNPESYEYHKARLSEAGFIIADPSLEISDHRLVAADLNQLARESGNGKAVGSVAIGIVLKLFGLEEEIAEQVFHENLAPKIIQANLQALHAGWNTVKAAGYDLPLSKDPGQCILVSGANLMAMGALAANVRFYSAYPMSPSTTILTYLSEHSQDMGVAVEQAEDEIAAINMALGAAAAGARAMTGTSGGGFSLMVEALGFAGIAEIPIVIANIQRPGPATGLPTRTEQSDLRFVITASQGEFPRMVISVQDHASCYSQTIRAFRLAEKYRIPVILLSDQYLADSITTLPLLPLLPIQEELPPTAEVEESGQEHRSYRLTDSGISPRLIPGRSHQIVRVDSDEHDEYGVITESAEVRKQMMDKRMGKLALLEQELIEPTFVGDTSFGTLLVGFGSTCGAIAEAVKLLNDRNGFAYGALCFGDVFPLPTKLLQQYANRAKQVVNVEQNATGQLAALIRETTGITCQHSILKYDGRPISADDIFTGLMSLEEDAANE